MGDLARPFVPPYVAVGVADGWELRGAIVFNSYTGPDIEMSLIGTGCWSRSVIRWAMTYVFRQLGCARLTVTVRASQPEHEAIAKRLGFVREGLIRRKFGDDDGIAMGMLAEECRWLRKPT